jgi:hypothetical protein
MGQQKGMRIFELTLFLIEGANSPLRSSRPNRVVWQNPHYQPSRFD